MNRPPTDSSSANDPLLMELLRHELKHPPFHAMLKPEPVSVNRQEGVVVVRLPYNTSFRRSDDSDEVHGGVIAALIDIAAHAVVAVQIGRMAPTVDLRIDYLRPATGDLFATARTLKVGRTIARADVEISGGRNEPPFAVGRGTFSTLAPASRSSSEE